MMETLLRGIEEYAPGTPAIIAGDMNTLTFNLNPLTFNDPDTFRALLKEDPNRFLNPIPHEPLFAVARKHGYEWQASNILAKSTQRYFSSPLSARAKVGRNLDWFFTRGVQPSTPSVINATPADIDWPLSDHELISVRIVVRKTN